MKRIIWIPIESLPERYSSQWNIYFPKYFLENNIPYVTINPNPLSSKIKDGSFLDVCGTNYYKALQTSELCKMMYEGKLNNDDILFFADCWNPSINSVAYIRDGLGMKFKIVGCLFAGTWDEHDFLTKKDMGYWGKDLENSWFRIVDKFFLATEFHKKMILSKRDCDPRKLIVTGHPLKNELPVAEKENIVVFPHRLDDEKNPGMFRILAGTLKAVMPDWKFILTKEVCETKEEYYNLLAKSKISVSCADQETFGFATIESMYADNLILAPNKLAYKELYHQAFLYDTFEELTSKIYFMSEHFGRYVEQFAWNKQYITTICNNAIPNMIEECLC
jgi:hypothetical protein